MGLAISVGVLADLIINDAEGAEYMRQEFARLNEVLRENGLPEHQEPEDLSQVTKRRYGGVFPYSFLHYLRRVAAYVARDENWKATSFPEKDDPTKDVVLEDESYMFDSHLICHSDCEGYYLPVKFSEILIDASDKNRIRGGLLGSSHKLMTELVQIAPALDIKLQNGELPETEIEKISEIDREEGELFREKAVWLSLFESARVSLESKTAIVFH